MTFPMLLQGKYLVSDELCLKTCDNGVQKCTNTILMLRFVTVLLKIGEAPLRVRSRGYVSFHLFFLFFWLPVYLVDVAVCFL